ncbi:hypothetical protein CHUAL_013867 [Chamberlinius hualienensis]
MQFNSLILTTGFLFVTVISVAHSVVDENNCEVCVKFLRKFSDSLTDDIKKSRDRIEDELKNTCEKSTGKDNRFCYYIGGLSTSATYIIREISEPVSWNMPSEKICERLKKKDSQVCELKYDKQIDFKTVDLKKLKVKELRKILDDWGENCEGCIEKADFIKLIEKLKPTYVKQEL